MMEEETYPVERVRNVAKHHRSADVAAIEDALTADTVVLVSWVTVGWRIERIGGRAVANEASLVVNARLDAVRRVWGWLARPR